MRRNIRRARPMLDGLAVAPLEPRIAPSSAAVAVAAPSAVASEAEVLNNPLYQASGHSGHNPLNQV